MAKTKRDVTVSVPLTGGLYRIAKGTPVAGTRGRWHIADYSAAIVAGVPEIDAGKFLWVVDSAVDEEQT